MQGFGTSLDQIVDFNVCLPDTETNVEEQKWREYPLPSPFNSSLMHNLEPLSNETNAFVLRSLDVLDTVSSHLAYLNSSNSKQSMLFLRAEQHCSSAPVHLLESPRAEFVPDLMPDTSAQSTPLSLTSDIRTLCPSPFSSVSSESPIEPYEEGASAPGLLLTLPSTYPNLCFDSFEMTSIPASASSSALLVSYPSSLVEFHQLLDPSGEGLGEPGSRLNPTKEKLGEKLRKTLSQSSPIRAMRASSRRKRNVTQNTGPEYTPNRPRRRKPEDTTEPQPLYVCDPCRDLMEEPQTFTRISDLRRHQKETCKVLTNPENKPACKDCGKLLSRGDAVKRHLEKSCTVRKAELKVAAKKKKPKE